MENEKEIMRDAVAEAYYREDEETVTRDSVARAAALIADQNGVNVQTAPYLQDLFYEALDEYFN